MARRIGRNRSHGRGGCYTDAHVPGGVIHVHGGIKTVAIIEGVELNLDRLTFVFQQVKDVFVIRID